MDSDIVAVTRHRPTTHESIILIAFTAFSHPSNYDNEQQRNIKPLQVEGVLDEIILEATLSHKNVKINGNKYDKEENYVENDMYINGLSEYELDVKEHINIQNSSVLSEAHVSEFNKIQLNFVNFKPGSIVAIKYVLI